MAHFVVDLEEQDENSRMMVSPYSHDDIETLVYRYRNAPGGVPPIILHKYFQASEKEDFLNIVTFETTDDKWEHYWNNQGKTILEKILKTPYFWCFLRRKFPGNHFRRLFMMRTSAI